MSATSEIKFAATDLASLQRVTPEMQQVMHALLVARNFTGYLALWSPRELSTVFLELASFLTDREFWPLLRQVWIVAETAHPDTSAWLPLFCSARSERHRLMTSRGRELLVRLPKMVTVFNAGGSTTNLAWTLDPKVAWRLATWSFGHCCRNPADITNPMARPTVAVGRCARKNVLAVFTEHGERTVIVDPSLVTLKPEHLWPRLGLS